MHYSDSLWCPVSLKQHLKLYFENPQVAQVFPSTCRFFFAEHQHRRSYFILLLHLFYTTGNILLFWKVKTLLPASRPSDFRAQLLPILVLFTSGPKAAFDLVFGKPERQTCLKMLLWRTSSDSAVLFSVVSNILVSKRSAFLLQFELTFMFSDIKKQIMIIEIKGKLSALIFKQQVQLFLWYLTLNLF